MESVNRTIREAFKKNKGRTSKLLRNIVQTYNLTYHRGIGLKPLEARNSENCKRVLEYSKKYSKEFSIKTNKETQSVGSRVLIKN